MIRRFLPGNRRRQPSELEESVRRAAELAEGALLGTHPNRAIWTDADYLTAVLAVLAGGDRARRAAYAAIARTPVEDDPPITEARWFPPSLENGWQGA